jgi:hypothetical protein
MVKKLVLSDEKEANHHSSASSAHGDISDYDEVIIEGIASEAKISSAFQLLKPSGSLVIHTLHPEALEIDVKLNGFINISTTDNCLTCTKPSWQLNDKAQIKLKPHTTNRTDTHSIASTKVIISLDDDDLIDEDALLFESKVPVRGDVAGCGSEAVNGKKRACKDCSCGS